MVNSDFDYGVYIQSLMKKASLIYNCMAELEKDTSMNEDLKRKTIEVLSAYSRSVNFKLEKTFKRDISFDSTEGNLLT